MVVPRGESRYRQDYEAGQRIDRPLLFLATEATEKRVYKYMRIYLYTAPTAEFFRHCSIATDYTVYVSQDVIDKTFALNVIYAQGHCLFRRATMSPIP
jgi:hypothetical protein